MNAETVVSVITGTDLDSDWNDSDRGPDNSIREDSYHVDKLTDQGKMADTYG